MVERVYQRSVKVTDQLLEHSGTRLSRASGDNLQFLQVALHQEMVDTRLCCCRKAATTSLDFRKSCIGLLGAVAL